MKWLFGKASGQKPRMPKFVARISGPGELRKGIERN